MSKAFRKLVTRDPDLLKVQENVEQAIKPLLQSIVVSGQVLKSVTVSAGSNNLVEHGLGREIQGYIVIKRSANSTVFDKPDLAEGRVMNEVDAPGAIAVASWGER